jgi:hypothetical protein
VSSRDQLEPLLLLLLLLLLLWCYQLQQWQ